MSVRVARGAYVLGQTEPAADPELITDGAVAYEDGRILAIGSWDQISEAYSPHDVFGSRDDLIIPGLVNSHHHVGLTPLQLGVPDLPLELWSLARNGSPPVDPYLDTLVAAFEMIKSGITTVHHIQGRLGAIDQWDEFIGSVLRAYSDIGMRVTYSVGLRDQSLIVQGDDAEFLSTLPESLANGAAASIRDQTLPYAAHLDRYFIRLYEAHGRNQRDSVRIQLAPMNLHWCSDDALAAVRDMAEEYDVGVHMHLLETRLQRAYAHRRAGVSAVKHLDSLGLLTRKLTLGHGVWLTAEDIALLAERGVALCHNPSSNLRLRSGIAPVNEFLARGLTVALGIDEAGINDDRDMFQEMRLALNLHRIPGLATAVPTTSDVWRMATVSGARTVGFTNEIGDLRVGALADLSIVNWRKISQPYLDRGTSVLDALVRRAKPSAVKTVIIGGTTVYDQGRFIRVDREAVFAELLEQMQNIDQAKLKERRQLTEALRPYVADFYQGWNELDPSEPFYQMNSRN